ncbi:FliM/FliN family flagellar motor switch protein [Roseateles sp. NT4]|uniref:FliM/FliN family flagellar motor switch protein n=1 Tax=Roseateles sp. NT4 TaxID=3453715 RepID=UPI003EECC5ED
MSVQSVELPPLNDQPGSRSAAPAQRLAALAGVKTELTVIAGRAVSQVGDILALKEGAVLTLDAALNAPFDVMLGDTLIARGELVAVGDQFGIRITQVAAADTPGGEA